MSEWKNIRFCWRKKKKISLTERHMFSLPQCKFHMYIMLKWEKKREMFLCYYTNITAQLSSHLWTGITFNILNVNVSLQQLHIVTPISCRICTLPSLSSMKDLTACCTRIYCSFVFSLSWKAKNVEHYSAFRCWDTCYILMFWHEQSVEIYVFPLHTE